MAGGYTGGMLVTVGLTPALQRVMVFDRYTPGRVNRARETLSCAAGKSVNAARAAKIFSPDVKVVAASVLGGATGGVSVSELKGLGIESVTPRVAPGAPLPPTRVCVTVLSRQEGTTTELVEESPELDDAHRTGLLEALSGLSPQFVLCAGTLAPGTPAEFYRQVVLLHRHVPVLVDAHGPALLQALGASTQATRIAKLNSEEAKSTTFCTDVAAAMTALHAAGATHVVVTDGAEAVHASDGARRFTVRPPRVTAVNTTGCGDCLAGVLAAAWFAGSDFRSAVVEAVAASAASAEDLLPSVFDRARQRVLREACAGDH